MKEIRWRDEKLYRITAGDYGNLIQRSFGVIANSIAKGTSLAAIVVFSILSPRTLTDLGRDWYEFLLPLVWVCASGSGIWDWSLYVREIEIRADQLVGHSRGRSSVVGIQELREISEGRYWTLFEWAHGLMVRSKKTSIFIPSGYSEYQEIKSRLHAWHPVVT